MEYKIYKLTFDGGVHFGDNSLENSLSFFHADTLFSALCTEAVKMGQGVLDDFVSRAMNGKLLLSDAFPFVGEKYFLPKPCLRVESKDDGNSVIKKKYKSLKYIDAELFSTFINGEYPIDAHSDDLQDFGYFSEKTSAAIRGRDETLPYRVGSFWFNKGNGLYILIGTDDSETDELIESLFEALSLTGIGGKRSEGFGRFSYYPGKKLSFMNETLTGTHKKYMTLSVSLPNDAELTDSIDNASYSLIKRSGFVYSDNFSDTFMRKKDMFVFDSGSVFEKRFEGGIYDVSSGGSHPVYRYAKPIFMGVDV